MSQPSRRDDLTEPVVIEDDGPNGRVPTTLPSPYVELDREAWSRLRENYPLVLDENDLARLRGLGDRVDLNEVEEVYLPCRGCSTSTSARRGAARRHDHLPRRAPREDPVRHRGRRLGRGRQVDDRPHPARDARPLARHAARRARHDRRFLFPNAELEERGLLQRKGFPESYDRRALLRFVAEVKSGKAEVTAPVYSHLTYDIVPGEQIVVRRPDVLIVEGLNVLQAPEVHPVRGTGLAVSDFFDFSVYVDGGSTTSASGTSSGSCACARRPSPTPTRTSTATRRALRRRGRRHGERDLARDQRPQPVQNILPTRSRATLVLSRARTTRSGGSA